MIELGKIQTLEVVRVTSVGVYLNDKNDKVEDDILLPKKQIQQELEIEDEIEVFVYRDSEDRMIATTQKPKITLGNLASLRAVEITKIGAFLDWGLEKDLFLPFKEQRGRIRKDKNYLVGLYIDKSNRLCATMNIYEMLSSESPYKKDDIVQGIVYNTHPTMGAFVAVDHKYHGLINENELYGGEYGYGATVEARVVKVKEDGKLDLSIRKKAYQQMDDDAELIMKRLSENSGTLQLNDNSDPDEIKEELNMSKGAFKRAVGRLLKAKEIKLTEKGIEMLEKQ